MQFLGAIAAAGLVSGLLPGSLQAENALASGATTIQGLILETLLTAELVMTIIMLAVEKSRTSFIAPLAIGLALFIAHLIGMSLMQLFLELGQRASLTVNRYQLHRHICQSCQNSGTGCGERQLRERDLDLFRRTFPWGHPCSCTLPLSESGGVRDGESRSRRRRDGHLPRHSCACATGPASTAITPEAK